MPFSWDQIIPGHQQTFKQKIIALYIDENRRLDGAGGVRDYMKEHYNFDKSVSTYRREFPKWGIKKNDYPSTVNRSSQNSVDSGYATASNRASSATTFSFETTSFFRRQSKQSQQSLLRWSFQNRLSLDAQSSYSRLPPSQDDIEFSDVDHSDDLVDNDNSINHNTEDDHLSNFSSLPVETIGPSSSDPVGQKAYQPPHAHPSRCSRAGANSECPDLGLETCPVCGATKLHHLASISRRTDVALFKEVVRSNLGSINEPDNEGNLCVHFAAGAGASLDQLAILERAGAHVTRPNYSGQTLLHVLDPQIHGRTMPAILTFAMQHGLSFSQRDCDGRTPLHHIFGRPVTITNIHDLMPFMDAAGRSMTFLDRNGNTSLDILRDNWMKANDGVHLAQLEAKLRSYNIPLAFSPLPNTGSEPQTPLDEPGRLAISSLDLVSTDILNIISRSQHEPYLQNSSGQNVLHALAAFSFHANYQISCYMTPCGLLECLQHRLENSASVGIDVNQYNSNGLTPLHCFLTATLDVSQDIPWLVPECLELLLRFGADPRMRDRRGNTALHLACSRGRFECAGKIISHLFDRCGKEQYVQCLSAVNDHGETVVEQAEACMSSETSEANDRRKQCIGLVRAALGEPMYSYMPAAYPSAASPLSTVGPSAMTWSAQLPNHGRNKPPVSSRDRKVVSLPLGTSSLEELQAGTRSAFED